MKKNQEKIKEKVWIKSANTVDELLKKALPLAKDPIPKEKTK